MNKKNTKYLDIIFNKSDWSVVKLSKNRKEFINKVVSDSYNHFMEMKKGSLRENIERTIHREKLRIKLNPWRIDPPNEKKYWNEIQNQLLAINSGELEKKEELEKQLLTKIIRRYSNEIMGDFKPSFYFFAQRFIRFGFVRLLNATRVKGVLSIFSREFDLDDKLNVVGEIEHIRNLAKKGTVVIVPTHFSNLDSILIGWVIQYLGLPPFIYGAGLNLFNTKILAYFMNSLGAYKVDRRKKNTIYLDTLKTYSRNALKQGCHSLFFPGGTRSRSGEIENKLKTGLLSTVIEAQRELYQEAKEGEEVKKIFIVPIVINYHFTLEAPLLIRDYLKKMGKERYYVETDKLSTSYKLTTFMLKFFTKGSDISVNIGKGLDILGNYVDNDGNSLDKRGNVLNIKDYFLRDKKITYDSQRESEYVIVLSKKIIEEYYKYNRVFSSHLVAFTAFKMLERQNPKLDLYHILRLSEEDLELDYHFFIDAFKKLRKRLEKIHQKGQIDLADHMKSEQVADIIEHGLQNIGLYHDKRPLIKKNNKIIIQDSNTLYYYHNRMNGYNLEKYI